MLSGQSDNNKCPACGQNTLFREFDCNSGEVHDYCKNCSYTASLTLRTDAEDKPVRQVRAAYPINGSLVVAAVDSRQKLITFEAPITKEMKKDDIMRLLEETDGKGPRSVYLKENGEYEHLLRANDDFFVQKDETDEAMLFVLMKAVYDINLSCPRRDGVTITITPFSPADIERLSSSGLNGPYIAQDHYLVRAESKECGADEIYLERRIIEQVSALYVVDNAVLTKNEDGSSTLNVDLCPYYNSTEHYPPKTIHVEFVQEIRGEVKEIYRSLETGRYYFRIPSPRESVAKWFSCYGPKMGYMDKAQIRANVTFRHGEAAETISWRRWDGYAAYDEQFHPNFREGGVT